MYDTWELLDTLDARVALLWILAGKDIDASVIPSSVYRALVA